MNYENKIYKTKCRNCDKIAIGRAYIVKISYQAKCSMYPSEARISNNPAHSEKRQ